MTERAAPFAARALGVSFPPGAMGDTVSLAHGHIEVEERPGYLLMVEHGTLRTVDDVAQYASALEILADRSGLRRAVIDSRQADSIEPPKDVREAMWKWLLSARAFDQIAFVLDNEMHLARVNMTALSHRANIKAFTAVHEAHRWLTGRQRTLSQGLVAVTGQLPALPLRDGPPRTPPPPRTSAAPRTPMPPPRAPHGSEPLFGDPGNTPAPPRRLSTPPPPADRSSAATRRTSEIAIPVTRAPDLRSNDRAPEGSDPSDVRVPRSEPRPAAERLRDAGVHGLSARRTAELAAARRAPAPGSTPIAPSRRSDVLPAITRQDVDDDPSDET